MVKANVIFISLSGMRSEPEFKELAMTCQATADTESHQGQELFCGNTKATDLFGILGFPWDVDADSACF